MAPKYKNEISDIQQRSSHNSFILIGDTQGTGFLEHHFLGRESNDSVQFLLFDSIASFVNEPAFIIHLGDMVYCGASEAEWKHFDEFTDTVRTKGIPIIPTLGNHEYFGSNTAAMENISARFSGYEDTTWRSFEFNGIGIILVNSNDGELADSVKKEQIGWYNKQLDRFKCDQEIKNILVTTHHPPYTNGSGIGFGDSEYVHENFVKPLNKIDKANLFFSGHCHSYEHLMIGGKHFIVSGGGGGPRRSLDLIEGYNDITTGAEKNKPWRDFNFCEVTILEDSLQIKSYRYNKKKKEWNNGDNFKVGRH